MLMNWQYYYSKNGHPTKSNLQIKTIPIEIPVLYIYIFVQYIYYTYIYVQFYMETQKIQATQNHPEQ